MKTYVYKGIGIKDDEFVRGNAPMTKEEVRTITLSKLKPQGGDIVVDIGAGTGSVSVECAFLAKSVIAIECSEESSKLIVDNATKFGLDNIEVIVGLAPESLLDIDKADCVFIGGSEGNLKAIVDWATEALSDGGRIAANFITLENAAEFIRLLNEEVYQNIDVAQVQVSKGKKVGDVTMLLAHNPVYVISGVRSR